MRYKQVLDADLTILNTCKDTDSMTAIEEQIARDICRDNKICTCIVKDGHCASIIAIAKRLAKQGYIPPSMQKGECK